MSNDDTIPGTGAGAPKRATQSSFEKETRASEDEAEREAAQGKRRRSVMGAPVDPNSLTTKGNFPPGVPAQDAVDPGRTTPAAAPVDNRSGRSADAPKHEK